jgi:CheY-like chemotaxis protein
MTGLLRAFCALFLNRTAPVWTEDEDNGSGQPADGRPKYTVLAIDDDPSFLSLLRPMLKDGGFNVLTSTSGPKGLEMVRFAGGDLSVVLLDYNMPQLNGAETLQYVRQLNANVKVMALTGVDINLLPASFHDGVDKFIRKPFRAQDLIDAINSLIGVEAPAPVSGKN